ncbi:hypothetical protein CYMTET_24148 [Cymbomonas tetramitiformis]|uniref:Uncharacterized protein n=1 Tax=Cymbomonas tetramitiformis TaxID=36881 RepID=A0AAE0FWY4_9CHLO|nr:hypothetical protein CYMTET_24148 [Cymbomonas tetramitiformis]
MLRVPSLYQLRAVIHVPVGGSSSGRISNMGTPNGGREKQLEEQLRQKSAELEERGRLLYKTKAAIEGLQQELAKAHSEEEKFKEQARTAFQEQAERVAELEENVEKLEEELASKDGEIVKRGTETTKQQADISRFEREIADVNDDLGSKVKIIEKMTDQMQNLEHALQKEREAHHQTQEMLLQKQNELSTECTEHTQDVESLKQDLSALEKLKADELAVLASAKQGELSQALAAKDREMAVMTNTKDKEALSAAGAKDREIGELTKKHDREIGELTKQHDRAIADRDRQIAVMEKEAEHRERDKQEMIVTHEYKVRELETLMEQTKKSWELKEMGWEKDVKALQREFAQDTDASTKDWEHRLHDKVTDFERTKKEMQAVAARHEQEIASLKNTVEQKDVIIQDFVSATKDLEEEKQCVEDARATVESEKQQVEAALNAQKVQLEMQVQKLEGQTVLMEVEKGSILEEKRKLQEQDQEKDKMLAARQASIQVMESEKRTLEESIEMLRRDHTSSLEARAEDHRVQLERMLSGQAATVKELCEKQELWHKDMMEQQTTQHMTKIEELRLQHARDLESHLSEHALQLDEEKSRHAYKEQQTEARHREELSILDMRASEMHSHQMMTVEEASSRRSEEMMRLQEQHKDETRELKAAHAKHVEEMAYKHKKDLARQKAELKKELEGEKGNHLAALSATERAAAQSHKGFVNEVDGKMMSLTQRVEGMAIKELKLMEKLSTMSTEVTNAREQADTEFKRRCGLEKALSEAATMFKKELWLKSEQLSHMQTEMQQLRDWHLRSMDNMRPRSPGTQLEAATAPSPAMRSELRHLQNSREDYQRQMLHNEEVRNGILSRIHRQLESSSSERGAPSLTSGMPEHSPSGAGFSTGGMRPIEDSYASGPPHSRDARFDSPYRPHEGPPSPRSLSTWHNELLGKLGTTMKKIDSSLHLGA